MKVGPPPARNRKTHPFQGTIDYQGLKIRVENKAGTTRRGVAEDGRPWSTTMKGVHYGELAGTKGADGDPVDVFVGPDPYAPFAYIIRQQDPATGKPDEDKLMLGLPNKATACAMYRAHYDRRGFLQQVRRVLVAQLRDVLRAKTHHGDFIDAGRRMST